MNQSKTESRSSSSNLVGPMFRLHMIFKLSSDNTNVVESVQEIIFGTIQHSQVTYCKLLTTEEGRSSMLLSTALFIKKCKLRKQVHVHLYVCVPGQSQVSPSGCPPPLRKGLTGLELSIRLDGWARESLGSSFFLACQYSDSRDEGNYLQGI